MDRNRFIQCMKSNIELSDKERRRIIRRSVESQPWKLKCTIAMEEFAELTQAISKQIRGYDNRIGLLEEMADAYICLEFLKSIFNITPEELQKAMDGPSKKDIWWQMIQLLPSSYNQTRNVMMNYEVLANIYKSRRGHKLDEWCDFCKWIETLPYSEIIMSSSGLDLNSINALQGAARNSSNGYIYKRKTED